MAIDPDFLEWQAAQSGNTNNEIDPDFLEWQQAQPSSWGDFALNLGKSAVKGGSDLAASIYKFSPFDPTPSLIKDINISELEANREKYIGDPAFKTSGERVAGKVAEYLPSALIPIGGGLGTRAVFSALSGLGGGIAKENNLPEMAGAVGLPLASGGIFNLLKGGYNAIKGALPTTKAANTLLETLGNDSSVIDDAIKQGDAFSQTRTLAEELQSPKVAQLQDALGKRSPVANDALVANENARREIQDSIFNKLSTQPVKTSESAGAELRDLVEGASKQTFDDIGQTFNSINEDATIPIQSLRKSINSILKNEYKAGGSPSSLNGIAAEINKTIDFGDIKGKPKIQTFGYVQDLRERVSNAWAEAKAVNDPTGARVAKLILNKIDDSIAKAPESGGTLSFNDVAKYQSAREQYSNAADIYKSGSLGATLNKMKEGDYLVDASRVVSKYFNGRPEGTQQLLKALPENPESLDIARGAIRDLIKKETITNDGIFAPEKFRSFLRNNKEALAAEVDGKRLFDAEHINSLEQIAKDLGFLSSQSKTSVKGLALAASKGQPTTAQSLIMQGFGDYIPKIPGVKQIAEWRNSKVDELLSAALISDKSFAQELLKKATPERVKDVSLKLQTFNASLVGSSQQLLGERSSNSDQPHIEDLQSLSSTDKAESLLQPKQQQQKTSSQTPIKGINYKPQDSIDEALNRAILRENGIDPADFYGDQAIMKGDIDLDSLKKALIKQESGGRADAVSPVGAQGLMQLMPATGKELAKEVGVKYDPFDKAQNEMLGTLYLKKQLAEFDGDVALALAAYNAGPNRVKSWIKRYGTTDWDVISKELRSRGIFKETRDYVPKILGNYKKFTGAIEV